LKKLDLPASFFEVKQQLDCTNLVIGDRNILTLLNALIVVLSVPKDSGIMVSPQKIPG
jgi:hypothetical protein